RPEEPRGDDPEEHRRLQVGSLGAHRRGHRPARHAPRPRVGARARAAQEGRAAGPQAGRHPRVAPWRRPREGGDRSRAQGEGGAGDAEGSGGDGVGPGAGAGGCGSGSSFGRTSGTGFTPSCRRTDVSDGETTRPAHVASAMSAREALRVSSSARTTSSPGWSNRCPGQYASSPTVVLSLAPGWIVVKRLRIAATGCVGHLQWSLPPGPDTSNRSVSGRKRSVTARLPSLRRVIVTHTRLGEGASAASCPRSVSFGRSGLSGDPWAAG